MRGLILLLVCMAASLACTEQTYEAVVFNSNKGSLFIMGGGKRPPAMIREMLEASGWSQGEYIMVFPMSSEEPDTAFHYAQAQFVDQGIPPEQVIACMMPDATQLSPSMLDSVRQACILYIPGGDQKRFMDIVLNTPLHVAIRDAFASGAMVAGTSAGAAVMSRLMITGNQSKYPEYTGNFRTIEAGNIELAEGLGLLDKVIVDQHFIYRMRLNRLISVVTENPGILGVGIDEATAILVRGDSARVVGESQVVVLRNPQGKFSVHDDLLGAENLLLDIMIPGSVFSLIP